MDLPVRVFWLMNSMINRIRAEQDIRALTIGTSTQSYEAAVETRENLQKEMGEFLTGAQLLNVKRDEEGVNELKQIAAKWR